MCSCRTAVEQPFSVLRPVLYQLKEKVRTPGIASPWETWCVNRSCNTRLVLFLPSSGLSRASSFLGKNLFSEPSSEGLIFVSLDPFISLLIESQDSFRSVVFSKHKKKYCVFCCLYSPVKAGTREQQPSSNGADWIWSSGCCCSSATSCCPCILCLRISAVKRDPGAHFTAGCEIPVSLGTMFLRCDFEDLQDCGLHSCSGKPLPMLDRLQTGKSVTEWFGLKETSKVIQSKPQVQWPGTSSTRSRCSELESFQGWGIHPFHGQSVPVFSTLTVKKPLVSNLNQPSFSLKPASAWF